MTNWVAAAGLMTMLLLKRLNVPLDRDVIFVSESGEEGSNGVGIGYVVKDHFPEIDAEYCLAEGGGVTRIGGEVKYATVQTLEKIPRGIELVSHGISGHGSIPLKSNAIVHLAGAVARVGEWRPDVRFNETTGTYFRKLAAISLSASALDAATTRRARYLLARDPVLLRARSGSNPAQRRQTETWRPIRIDRSRLGACSCRMVR